MADPGQNPHPNPTKAVSFEEQALAKLLPLDQRKPWIVLFFEEVRDYFAPKKQEPLVVTSKPLGAKDLRPGTILISAKDDGIPRELPKSFRPGERVDSDHLERLAHTGEEVPGYLAFFYNIRDYFFPKKQPPLEVTSKPVQVKSIWGFTGGKQGYSSLISMGAHVAVVAVLFLLGAHYVEEQEVKETVSLVAPVIELKPFQPKLQEPKPMGGGGGGGDRSPTPASKGKLPPVADKQFVPPAAVVHNPEPKLVMQPTIIVQPDASLPDVDIMAWGNPLGVEGPPSSGPGSGGGIGSGSGGGVGSGKGPGFGPGEGGGTGGGVYKIGGGVSAPTLIYKVEPEYSEEARKAKFQGTVVLYVVVNEKGLPEDLKVVHALGLGLDEKAIEAVKQWRFRPGYLEGKPVKVAATIEVNFRLL